MIDKDDIISTPKPINEASNIIAQAYKLDIFQQYEIQRIIISYLQSLNRLL